jgi:hypothetical protein
VWASEGTLRSQALPCCAYLHGGVEVHANDAIAIDVEFGLHIIPQTLYPEGAVLGEIVARVKVGL